MSQSLEGSVTWHVCTRITEDGLVCSSFFRTSLTNHCFYWEWWPGHVGMMDESYFGPEEFPKHRVMSPKISQHPSRNRKWFPFIGDFHLVLEIILGAQDITRWLIDESGGQSHFSVERWFRGEQLSGVMNIGEHRYVNAYMLASTSYKYEVIGTCHTFKHLQFKLMVESNHAL